MPLQCRQVGNRRPLITVIVPETGIYTITHDPAHADMPHEVTVSLGRREFTQPVVQLLHKSELIK